ncbi:MAG: SurA N-terminal domain-containing protein [Parvibaculales bacterium]
MKSYIGGFFGLLLIGLLVVAFAAWGVSDVFNGFNRGTIASVGDRDIPTNEFRYRYARELDFLSRQLNEPLTLEQGSALGLDRQVLADMMAMATFDQLGEDLGLAVSDDIIAEKIVSDPAFAGPNGRFDRPTFQRLLQSNGLSEKIFVRDRRLFETRRQLLDAVGNSVRSPETMNELVFNYLLETRVAEYVVLQMDSIDEINEPSDDELRSFYDQAPNIFTEPERRSATLIILDPNKLAESLNISDDELLEEYENLQDTFIEAETREVDQLVLADDAEIAKAQALLAEGGKFDEIAAAFGLTAEDTDLGTVTRDDFIAPELADIAFSIAAGENSGIQDGPLGQVILRVRTITPQQQQDFVSVKEQIRTSLSLDKATEEVILMSEKIEDERAQGTTLEGIARIFDLELIQIDQVDLNGLTKEGDKPDILNRLPDLQATLFENELGQDLPSFETSQGGAYWVRMDGIKPSRISPFEDVREKARAQWQAQERRALLVGLAEHFVEKGNQGESLTSLADELGKSPLTSPPLLRSTSNETFSREAVANLFQVAEGAFTFGKVGFGESLIVMRLDAINSPEKDSSAQYAQIAGEETARFNENLLNQLLRALQTGYGVRIDQQVLNANTNAQQ